MDAAGATAQEQCAAGRYSGSGAAACAPFVFFGSLLLFVGEHTDGERGYATDAFGAVLALVMSAGLLVAVYYVLVDALGRDRVEREERLLLEKAEGLIHHLVPTSPKRTVAFAADEKKEIELADVYGGSSSSDDDASFFASPPSSEAATTPRAAAEEKRPEEAKREATPKVTPKESTPRRGRSFRAKAIAAHRAKKSAAAPAPAAPRPPKGMSLAGIFGVPQSPEAASVQI